MTSNTWIILDVPYLCHRAFHTTRGLSWRDNPTGVLYGVFRDIFTFREDLISSRFVFCFDHGISKRRLLLPTYKHGRRTSPKQKTEDEKFGDNILRQQITDLKYRWLPRIGFRNVFFADGYEADDLIASIIYNSISTEDTAIIISNDHDLYQLLEPNDTVIMWNPTKRTPYTAEMLKEEYGVSPASWEYVKAIAGCKSDTIPGVKGVGEKTAAKYLTCSLPKNAKAHQTIEAQRSMWYNNIRLVSLPFDDTPVFKLHDDDVTREKWDGVLRHLGMKSLFERI